MNQLPQPERNMGSKPHRKADVGSADSGQPRENSLHGVNVSALKYANPPNSGEHFALVG